VPFAAVPAHLATQTAAQPDGRCKPSAKLGEASALAGVRLTPGLRGQGPNLTRWPAIDKLSSRECARARSTPPKPH